MDPTGPAPPRDVPPYTLVACDLDGTLLTPGHRLGAYTRGVLNRLHGRGIGIVLASGRHSADLSVIAAGLAGGASLISSNGAAVHAADGTPLSLRCLPPDCVRFLLGDRAFAPFHVNLYRAADWLTARADPDLLRFYPESGFSYRVADLTALDPDEVLKVFFRGEPVALGAAERLIRGRFAERVATTFSEPGVLEVMARGVSKGAALAEVAARAGVDLAEVIAFGDAPNDREMLERAGLGLLMANADPWLAAALPHLGRIGSNADESVARHLEALFLAP